MSELTVKMSELGFSETAEKPCGTKEFSRPSRARAKKQKETKYKKRRQATENPEGKGISTPQRGENGPYPQPAGAG
jgi:hypothetical protein